MTTPDTKATIKKRLNMLVEYKCSLLRINEQSMAADIEMGKVLEAESNLRQMLKDAAS